MLHRYARHKAVVCLDFKGGTARRYYRDVFGRIVCSDEYAIDAPNDLAGIVERLRAEPEVLRDALR